MLSAMGAEISGAGTNRIEVKGQTKLGGATHTIGADFMEVGSFICLGAMSKGKVKIKNVANNATMNYTLVAESEADIKKGKISVNSPIGKGLLGKAVGDIAEISVPRGTMKFEIVEISR